MKKTLRWGFLGLSLCLGAFTGCGVQDDKAPTISSTFDQDAEDWRVLDFLSGSFYRGEMSDESPSWVESDGLEGGHIEFEDYTHMAFFFTAPDQYLGDKTAYRGGEFQFALRTNFSDWPHDAYVILGGDTDILYFKYDVPAEMDTWTEYVVQLEPDAGWYLDIMQEAVPTSEQFDRVLSNLEFVRISGELAEDLKEISKLDSVSLIAP